MVGKQREVTKEKFPMEGARKLAYDRMVELGLNMTDVSRRVGNGRNLSYFQQWTQYGKPKLLPDEKRRDIADVLGLDETLLIDDKKMLERYNKRQFTTVASDDVDTQNIAQKTQNLKPGEIVEREVVGGLGLGGYASEIVSGGVRADHISAIWVLPVRFIHDELRAKEQDLDIIVVDGNSMYPTLGPGDRVLVHRLDKSPSPEGVFVIDDQGIGISIKRLQLVRGSSPPRVRVISDSSMYPDVDTVPLEEVKILGRVICKISRL